MAITNQIHSIIVSALNADFTAHTYSEVVAVANTTAVINGVSVIMPAGLSIKINVFSIGANANVFLLGDNKNLSQDAPVISS